MGKLRHRLDSRKKAKRWAKGKSSSSNPETRKYRDQSRSCYFQANLGSNTGSNTGFTSDSLRIHVAMQGTQPEPEKIDVDEVESSIGGSTFKTFDTFASDWSNCSNLSFSRFLANYQSNSSIHKEMLAILAAVSEVIKEKGGTETSTEYFGALLTLLETAESEESLTAILSLLGMGMKTVPKSVLKALFGQASKTLMDILIKYAKEEHFAIMRLCIGCLSTLLRVQEAAVWSNSSTMHVAQAILAFTINSKPKVRKAAQHAICVILKGSDIMKTDNPPPYHPCAPQVAKHCLAQLEMTGQPGQMTCTLHILTLLKEVVHQFPKTYVKSVSEGLLSIMTLNNVLVTSCCFQTLHGLFVLRPTEAVLPGQLNAQIINALYDYQPPPGDTQPTLAWLAVMQEAHCNLALISLQLCGANITRIIEKCIELWTSDKTDVLTGTSHTIKALIEGCIGPMCKNDVIDKHKTTLIKVTLLLQQGMKYQFNSAWHHVLHILAVMIQTIGPNFKEEVVNILKGLADLRESHRFTYNSEIEYAVGAAVKSFGPEIVLSAIPLQTNDDVVDLRRSWLLPVLKDCISNANLSYFINSLLPLAERSHTKSKSLKENKDTVGAHTHELITSQIWALLPSFCNSPKDIQESFKNIAQVLGILIAQRKELRLSVMASLRKLIQKSVENENREDVEELARFAKNYLPLLFNLYTIQPHGSEEEGHRLATFEAIKVYLSITNKELIGEFFDKALDKLDSKDTESYVKESVFDLIRILTQYTDESRIKSLYDKCIPLLSDTKNYKEQKKAYRFLEEICGSESDVCKKFVIDNRRQIQKELTTTQFSVHSSCKGARIRCLIHLSKCHPQLEKTKFLKAIVPEAVMGVKELNEKSRASAYNLLNTIADKFLSNFDNLQEYIVLIQGVNDTVAQRSAMLLALSSITYNYNGSLGIQKVTEILNNTCGLMEHSPREVVLSCLAFIKVYLSVMPLLIVAPNLKSIVKGMTTMTDDCKRHFRQKVRDLLIKMVRKFGADIITSLIPVSDETMHKRLKNIQKIEGRKQKSKEKSKNKSDKDDSDNEFNAKRRPKSMEEILADSDDDIIESVDEKTSPQKRKSQKKMWIQENDENIVDFIDPAASKNITATQPGTSTNEAIKPKKMDCGFKTAPDGRLIFSANDDEDSEDEKKTKKKNKLPFMETCSDNEEDDEDDAKSTKSDAQQKRKRKFTDTESVASSVRSRYTAGGSGIHRPLKNAKQDKGAEYRSKKAKGDVKRKGKHEPYAYYPLSRSSLNKRKNKKKN